jgi:Flp pilus assembly protein TadD
MEGCPFNMKLPSKTHVSYANGYRELGMHQDALEELEKIDPPQRNDKQVLACRLAIHMDLEDWSAMVDVSRELALQNPKEPEWWINWAFGVRRSESLSAAEVILHEALEAFPDEPCIHFNLGCYACVQGRLDVAKDRLLRAIELSPSLRKSALKDEDLTVLRDWLRRVG